MIVPVWYLILWACSAMGYLALAIAVFRKKLLNTWPSLFFIGLDHVAMFAIGQATRHQYRVYFWSFWCNTVVISLLQVWLSWDIWRSIPSVRFFPRRVLVWAWGGTVVVAIVLVYLTRPTSAEALIGFATQANRCMQYTLALTACWLLFVVFSYGLGFSRTGFNVLIGAAVHQTAAVLMSFLIAHPSVFASYGLANPLPRTIVRFATAVETTTSCCVALFWIATISSESTHEHMRREMWRAYVRN